MLWIIWGLKNNLFDKVFYVKSPNEVWDDILLINLFIIFELWDILFFIFETFGTINGRKLLFIIRSLDKV